MNPLQPKTLILPLLVALGFLALTWPVWQWLWGEWLGNQYYSHGLLILPVSLFLAVQRLRLDKQPLPRTGALSHNLGVLLLGATLISYLWFFNQKAYYLAAFSMIGMAAGAIWTLGGLGLLRRLLFPVAYLLLMIPLPFVDRVTLPLALFTGVCAGGLARFLGSDVLIVGNAVSLPNAELVIGAQCSGVNSLIALTSLMTLAAYVLNGPLWGRIVLVLLSIPLAMVGNILRVTSLLFVARSLGAEAAFIFYHDYSGLIFFLLVFLLMFPLTRLLQVRKLRLDVI
ncbi:MAG: exosortase/archaeosortase family protein [Caldilineaceae bacterium]|nr:exosortase/archaeosortase family protein [Caldilineaceae bacterium]